MYVVLHLFDDLDDKEKVLGIESYHRYNVGDEYPREGYTPTAERIESLLTGNNARKVPLIGVLEEEQEKLIKAEQEAVKAKQEAPKAEQKTETTSASAREKTTAAAKKRTARRPAKKE